MRFLQGTSDDMSVFESKLPKIGTTIFTVMSALAKKHNAINLSQGFPDFDCDRQLKDLVYKYMLSGHNQYAPMRGVENLLHSIAAKIKGTYDLALDAVSEITITSGAAEAIYTAITTVVRPDDEVIVIDPAYDLYKPAIEVNGGVPVVYPLYSPDYQINWNELESLITDRTRMIIINTPHNPIGKTLRREDLLALEVLVARHNLYVISDEVYEHLVFDKLEHEGVLNYPTLYQRSFVVFSFGKTFHATGWRIGYCIAPPHLTTEFRKVHQFNVFTVITPVQYALAEYLHEPKHYQGLSKFFETKRDFLENKLKGSRFTPLPSTGSYFQLYDYSQISDLRDVEFVKKLTIDHGVAAIPISVFYSQPRAEERLIRLCFGKTEATLAAAAERLIDI